MYLMLFSLDLTEKVPVDEPGIDSAVNEPDTICYSTVDPSLRFSSDQHPGDLKQVVY